LRLVFVCLIITIQSYAQHIVRGEDVTINSQGYLTSYKGPEGNIVIPDQIDGKVITGISDGNSKWLGVFANKSITAVRFPAGLTYIGDFAFFGNPLTTVTIPASVTAIGASSFLLNSLREIVFKSPGKLTHIGDYAFCANVLTRIALPASLTNIGKSAFFNNQIADIILPKGISRIGSSAFNRNKVVTLNGKPSRGIIYGRMSDGREDKTTILGYGGVSEVIDFIPPSVATIAEGAFYANEITSVIIPGTVKVIGPGSFSGNSLEKVAIPESIKEIPDQAFMTNKLKEVILPNSISDIGKQAFAFNALKNITLPNSVIHIGAQAFAFNAIESFKLPSPEMQGRTFVKWEGNGGIAYKGGADVNDHYIRYTAVFKVSE
jgi:hypothetical protein